MSKVETLQTPEAFYAESMSAIRYGNKLADTESASLMMGAISYTLGLYQSEGTVTTEFVRKFAADSRKAYDALAKIEREGHIAGTPNAREEGLDVT